MMDDPEGDVQAYMALSKDHRTTLHSTNPLERLNAKIKRRAGVVGTFPDGDAVICLVGAILLDRNDQWAVQRSCHVKLETIAPMSDDTFVKLAHIAAGGTQSAWPKSTTTTSLLHLETRHDPRGEWPKFRKITGPTRQRHA